VIRRLALIVAIALLGAGCADHLGRRAPSCDITSTSATLLLQAQSIPGTEYVPCVGELRAGWDYEHAVVRSGKSVFWISSDRVGERFLEVSLEPTCDLDGTVRATSDEGAVPLYVDVRRSDTSLSVVVVPEGDNPTTEAYASEVADLVRGSVLRDRPVGVRVDLSGLDTMRRIEQALEAGDPVLVVGPREREEGLAEMYLPGGGEPERLEPTDALHEIEETLDDTVYEATWHYPFRDGCVTYEFDAKGPGVDTLPEEVQQALGLYPVDPLRAFGERVGWVLP
jgi:hypothetical protein